jgi:hypothetical protein
MNRPSSMLLVTCFCSISVCVYACMFAVRFMIKDRSDDISIGRAHACVYVWIMPVFMYVCRSACVYL